MKQLTALLLALALGLSLAACGGASEPETTVPVTTQAATEPPATEPADTYTYNVAADTFPAGWNPHTWQTAAEEQLLGYLAPGLYRYDYNETGDGCAVLPDMAAEQPQDVTGDYTGSCGLEAGDQGWAWKIILRQDLCWQDGTKITAHDFAESARRLLDPQAGNSRADSLYAGNLVIHNARSYREQGVTAPTSLGDLLAREGLAGLDALLEAHGEEPAWINWAVSFGSQYDFDAAPWNGGRPGAAGFSLPAENAMVQTPLTLSQMREFYVEALKTREGASEQQALFRLADEVCVNTPGPGVDWDQVGILTPGDYELVLILDRPLTASGLKAELTASWLVHTALYDSLAAVTGGVYSNRYGTSVDTTMSCGPYVLTSFQADKQYTLRRSDAFYGLTADTYQTTDIVVDYIPQAETRLELFQQGKLDEYVLSAGDMEQYAQSEHLFQSAGEATFGVAIDPDRSTLERFQEYAGENVNKTILTVPQFRMALSLSMDRAGFCQAVAPANIPAYGLFSGLMISDPEAGTPYRTTQAAVQALEGTSCYDLDRARQLFDEAYDIAIADGLMDGDDEVQIKLSTPNEEPWFYVEGASVLARGWTEALKGTKLEDKVTFWRNYDSSTIHRYEAGNSNISFGVGWAGSPLDPYSLLGAYVTPEYQYDNTNDSIDYTAQQCTISIGGMDYTASVWDWYCMINGEKAAITASDGTVQVYSCGEADGDPQTRLEILAALEKALLQNYSFIPLMHTASATLKGRQIAYPTGEYLYGVGFGGVKNYTYHYSDEEWADYVAGQGGVLDYT